MVSRSHDLAAFTALNLAFVYLPLKTVSLATLGVAITANMLGGLMPDLDNHNSDIWDKFRGGGIISRLISPLFGGHRLISHSLLGFFIFAYLSRFFLQKISTILIVDLNLTWWAFLIGYISHLVADAVTKEGIPLFFPFPINIGFPPFKFLRIKTGGFIEKGIIFPGMVILNFYLVYQNYGKFLEFLRNFVK